MGFSDYLMVSIVAELKMDYRCITLMQKVGLGTTQKLERIELQLDLSGKLCTESGALCISLQKNRAEDKCQPSPAIRTPRRSGWAGGRGNTPGNVAANHQGVRLRLNGDHRAVTGIRRTVCSPAQPGNPRSSSVAGQPSINRVRARLHHHIPHISN